MPHHMSSLVSGPLLASNRTWYPTRPPIGTPASWATLGA